MDVDEVPAAGGSRPDRLEHVSGPQERVQRHFVEQLVEPVRGVPVLDAPVPQMVDQLVDVLKIFDRGLTEQVIEVPKDTLQDVVPHHAALRVPQLAEQLVDVPVPESVILARGRCALGAVWYHVAARGERSYWWMGWLIPCSVAPPAGIHRQPRAGYKYWAELRRGRLCDHLRQAPAVLRRVRGGASDSVLRQSGGFSCFTETGTQCKLCRRPLRSHNCSSWTGWDTRCCSTTGAWGWTVPKTVELPQLQCSDKVNDVPVAQVVVWVSWKVPQIQFIARAGYAVLQWWLSWR